MAGEGMNWRKEVDFKVKRVESLVFGAESALESNDPRRAHLCSLALIGFLDSHPEQSCLLPIRRRALSILLSSRRSFDEQAFEQAARTPARVFKSLIFRHSKYLAALPQGNPTDLKTDLPTSSNKPNQNSRKRSHVDVTTTPTNEINKAPSEDVSANGFVSARAKLVVCGGGGDVGLASIREEGEGKKGEVGWRRRW